MPVGCCAGDDNPANIWKSATPWLKDRLLNNAWDLDLFRTHALYPDQLVFLAGQLAEAGKGDIVSFTATGTAANAKAILFHQSGEVLYVCGQNEAQTIEETQYAILFTT